MRMIAHIDLDAFFASIEERDNPRLKGKPIVVGADPLAGRGRGVVSTANYAARAYGIRSALPISTAWRFSEAARRKGLPPAAFLDVNMEKYAEESRRVMDILREGLEKAAHGTQVVIEQASVDEAYLDLSFTKSYDAAREVAQKIKQAIKDSLHLTASVGVGPNKLIAKIASDVQKPDGLTVVREEDAEKFLEPMSVRKIPGVGPKAEERFKAMGIRTVQDAKRLTLEELRKLMGKWGAGLYEKLRGRDDSPLVTEWIPKSIGEQTTFMHDAPVSDRPKERKVLTNTLEALAAGVHERFLNDVQAFVGHDGAFTSFRAIAITVRFADFVTATRTVTLPEPVLASDPKAIDTLKFQALRLFMPFLDRRENPQHKAIRLLGVRVERLG